MKIACIGNMNNFLFSVTRHLRDHGFDAHLFLLENEEKHFLPQADTFNVNDLDYVHQLSWGSAAHCSNIQANDIKQSLIGFDKLIVSDTVPAYLAKAGLVADIFIPHGSDLFQYPFHRIGDMLRADFNMLRFNTLQRKGIRDSKAIVLGELTENLTQYIDRLGVSKSIVNIPVPMIYTPDFNYDSIKKFYPVSTWYKEFSKTRSENDVIIFHHARHIWKAKAKYPWNQRRLELHYKSNDNLLRGFAAFVKKHPEKRICLITFDYGGDVAESKKLVEELEISGNVRWFPKMERKEIMVGLSLADIGTGEFFGGWYHAGVIFEVLAMGKPLIHYFDNREGTDVKHHNVYPFYNARTSEEIAEAMDGFINNSAMYQKKGDEGYQWLLKEIITIPIQKIISILKAIE